MRRSMKLYGAEGGYTRVIHCEDERRTVLDAIYSVIVQQLGEKYGSYSFSCHVKADQYAVTLSQGPVSVVCRLVSLDTGTVITLSWHTFLKPHLIYVADAPDQFSYDQLLLAIGRSLETLTSNDVLPSHNPARARMFTILKDRKSPEEQTNFDLDKHLMGICAYINEHPNQFSDSAVRRPVASQYFDNELWVLWGRVFEDGTWLFCHPGAKSFSDPIFIPKHFGPDVCVRFPPNAPWKQVAALLSQSG